MCCYCPTLSSIRTVGHTLKCCQPSKKACLCSCRLTHLQIQYILCIQTIETFPYILSSLLKKFPVFVITKIVLVSSGFVSGGECVPISGGVPEAAAAQCHFPVPEPLSPIHTLYWSGGQSSCPAGSLRINTHPTGGKTQEEHCACAEV